jgi:hypothetical protein
VDLLIAVSGVVQIFCVENIIIALISEIPFNTVQSKIKKKESYVFDIELPFSAHISFIS